MNVGKKSEMTLVPFSIIPLLLFAFKFASSCDLNMNGQVCHMGERGRRPFLEAIIVEEANGRKKELQLMRSFYPIGEGTFGKVSEIFFCGSFSSNSFILRYRGYVLRKFENIEFHNIKSFLSREIFFKNKLY